MIEIPVSIRMRVLGRRWCCVLTGEMELLSRVVTTRQQLKEVVSRFLGFCRDNNHSSCCCLGDLAEQPCGSRFTIDGFEATVLL